MRDENVLAGFFDGRGSIRITQYRVYASLTQKDAQIPIEFHNCFGGEILLMKEAYKWNIAGLGAIEFLRRIISYLAVKKALAEMVIEYWETNAYLNNARARRILDSIQALKSRPMNHKSSEPFNPQPLKL